MIPYLELSDLVSSAVVTFRCDLYEPQACCLDRMPCKSTMCPLRMKDYDRSKHKSRPSVILGTVSSATSVDIKWSGRTWSRLLSIILADHVIQIQPLHSIQQFFCLSCETCTHSARSMVPVFPD